MLFRSVQDDKAIEAVVIVGDNPDDTCPMLQPHIAGVDGRVEGAGVYVEVEASKLRHFVEDKVEVEALQRPCLGVLPHADGAARVDEEHARPTCCVVNVLPHVVFPFRTQRYEIILNSDSRIPNFFVTLHKSTQSDVLGRLLCVPSCTL